MSKKRVEFAFASGVEHVAGLSWLIGGNTVCLSACLRINGDITSNTDIVTGMSISGVSINEEWAYGICRQGDQAASLVATDGRIYVESDLLRINGEYIIITATCALK